MAKEEQKEQHLGTAAKGMRWVAAVVLLGWLMMWIMMPTSTYREIWSPSIKEKTTSTYLGMSQGGMILIYVFPILFVAVLGCVYAHLQQKRRSAGSGSGSSSSSRWLAPWRRPMLMRGPLGIVTYVEVAFLVMFLALLIWYFCMAMHVSLKKNKEIALSTGETLAQTNLMLAAHRLGLVGNVALAFLFFPVTRASSVLPLLGLTSEASVRYHIWIGHIAMIILTSHGLLYFVYWGATGNAKAVMEWPKVGISNLAGELSLLFGVGLWVTTFPRIRRKMFEVFFYTHQLYSLFLLFYAMHVSFSLVSTMLPGIYLFMLDRYLRFLQSRDRVRLVSARLLPGDTVELNFAKSPGCEYTVGSVAFVNVPSLSKLQWHPFTICSSSSLEPERLSVVIKREGSWTQKLHRLLASPSPAGRLDISLEGPYGPSSNHFLRFDSLVLISGGSGITPFMSLIRELIHHNTTTISPSPSSVHLIAAFKTSDDLSMLDLLLPPGLASSHADVLSRLRIRIDAFVTREHQPSSTDHIRSVSFKPSTSDLPVSNVLGPNSWLWLAAVIASSFVAYLIMLGLLYRYYVYPIDSKSNSTGGHDHSTGFSYAGKAMLNVLFMCIGIAMCGGLAVMLNRARLAREGASRTRVSSFTTPGASPGKMLDGAEQELESFPRESVLKATTVQYGARPNLKKMLLDCTEPNTGVFASGPTSMRREVALVCGSGLADNLHYESVSFSW